MASVKREIEIPKECDDVAKFIVLLVSDLKSGKNAAAIAGDCIPALLTAVEGFGALGEEVKDAAFPAFVALLVADLYAALTKKADAATAVLP